MKHIALIATLALPAIAATPAAAEEQEAPRSLMNSKRPAYLH